MPDGMQWLSQSDYTGICIRILVEFDRNTVHVFYFLNDVCLSPEIDCPEIQLEDWKLNLVTEPLKSILVYKRNGNEILPLSENY